MAALAPRFRVERGDGVLVLALAGEHDMTSRYRIQGAIDDALAGGLAVVVDLREADFVDSVIAAVLLDARKQAMQADLGFAIVLSESAENGVRRMFELSTLTSVFAVYASPVAAITAVRPGFAEKTF